MKLLSKENNLIAAYGYQSLRHIYSHELKATKLTPSVKFSINELVKKSHSYSFVSKADMRHMHFRCVKDLHELGYKVGHIEG